MENQVFTRISALLHHFIALFAIVNVVGLASITHAQEPPKEKTEKKAMPTEVKSLVKTDMKVGTGLVAKKGDKVKVNYTGWLYDPAKPMGRGTMFDTSIGREPFEFKLGEGVVIKGWDEGFGEMRVGGKRQLIIPSEMGYGARGAGSQIPPNSPLMFEVELLAVNGQTKAK